MKIKWFFASLVLILLSDFKVFASGLNVGNLGYGIKYVSPVFELRFFQKEENKNLGISVSSQSVWKNYPCVFEYGKLKAGGVLSFFKSPDFSDSVTPFSSVKKSAEKLSVSLCGFDSFPESDSAYLKLGWKNSKEVLSELNVSSWCNFSENVFAASLFAKITPSKKNDLSFCFSSVYYPYDKNTFYSWFHNSSVFFHEGNGCAFGLEVNYSTPCFLFDFFSASFSSPFGDFNFVYRAQTKLVIDRFIFTLSAFYNPNENLLLLNESELDRKFQLKSGLSCKFTLGQKNIWLCKAGFSGLYSVNLSKDYHPLKFAYGMTFTRAGLTLSVSAASNFKLNTYSYAEYISFNQIESFSYESQILDFSSSWNAHKTGYKISAAYTYKPQSQNHDFNHKYSFELSKGTKQKVSFAGGISQSIKNGSSDSFSLTSSANVQLQYKKIIVLGKISFNYDL